MPLLTITIGLNERSKSGVWPEDVALVAAAVGLVRVLAVRRLLVHQQMALLRDLDVPTSTATASPDGIFLAVNQYRP